MEFKDPHDGIGDIHDFKTMRLRQLEKVSGSEIKITHLFAQNGALHNGVIARRPMRRIML